MKSRPALRTWHLVLALVLVALLVMIALAKFRREAPELGVLALPLPGERQAAAVQPQPQVRVPAPVPVPVPVPTPVQAEIIDELAALAPTAALTAATGPASPSSGDMPLLRARNLRLPVQGISAGQLSDTYTQARATGRPHEALDIMAARGTPVLAVEDGRVAKLFLSKPGGITLYQFDPSGDYAYYYAHLDRYADGVVEGVALHKGDVIGYVGSSGNALPGAPHLHFAVFRLGPERQWWRGTALNPFLLWRD